jgi:chaperonin cofactor prefoldin
MKVKFVLALLLIACLVLAGVFYSYKSKTDVEIKNLSDEKVELNGKLKDYTNQNMDLNTRLQKLQGDLEAVRL